MTFDWVVTAQQVGSYKPNPRNFEFAFERIDVPRERILHVAQSLFHDHVTARQLRPVDRLDRPPPRQAGLRRHTAGRGRPRRHGPSMASFADLALA